MIDFGNLFTDWESELWEVNSNEVERRTLQSYSSRLTERYDFSSSQAPRPLWNFTVNVTSSTANLLKTAGKVASTQTTGFFDSYIVYSLSFTKGSVNCFILRIKDCSTNYTSTPPFRPW